jgi:hypothetical protein
MSGFLCSMVGASFTVAAAAEVIRAKKGITAVGNAQVDTAQSKFGAASALFDGDGDYLAIANMTSANTFTFESWIRFASLPGSFQMLVGSSSSQYFALANVSGSYFWELSVWTSGFSQYVVRFPATVSTNTWYHIATQKTGTTISLYQDGTSISSSATFNTLTTAMTLFDTTTRIGAWSNDAYSVNGHMDEVRISDSVRYTAGFTPSTTPFVNDANTLLLIHADGTDASTYFEDDNGIGRTQNNGRRFSAANISTTRSKFGGSSIYFDGVDDRVTLSYPITRSDNQDFTFEFWVNEDFVQNCKYIGGQSYGDIFIGHDNYGNDTYNNRLAVGVVGVGWYMDFGVTLAADTWYHICVQRSGDTVYGYTDGTLRVTHTGYLANITWAWTNMVLSGEGEGTTPMNGYLDEIRLSDNVRYTTSGFTAPTAPFVNDANTLVLIHADGTNGSTVFRDDNGSRNQVGLFSTGGALISTTQSKFGGSSMYFDGTDDLVRSGVYNSLALNTGSWTIEGWIYTSDTLAEVLNYQDYNTNNGWAFGLRSSGRLLFVSNDGSTGLSVILSSNNAYTNNTWTHFAVVYNGSTLTLYANGTSVGSSSWVSPDLASVDGLRIGSGYGNSGGLFVDGLYYYVGYLDEVRISNTARYTANFSVATAPFQNDANTVLLMHGDGTNNSTVFTDDNGTRPV